MRYSWAPAKNMEVNVTEPNIDRFNEIAGCVLAHLYQSFPIPAKLKPSSIGLKDLGPDDYATISLATVITAPDDSEAMFFRHTVKWLISNGFLTAMPYIQSDSFGDAVLTPKGLEVLNSIPESLSAKQPIGERLTEATKTGAKEILRSVASEAISIGVRSFMGQA